MAAFWTCCCILLLTLIIESDACVWNDCLCLQSKIICDETNAPNPRFTEYERKFVNGLVISSKQAPTLLAECHDLPRLDYIVIKDQDDSDIREAGPNCPKPRCQGVKVICR